MLQIVYVIFRLKKLISKTSLVEASECNVPNMEFSLDIFSFLCCNRESWQVEQGLYHATSKICIIFFPVHDTNPPGPGCSKTGHTIQQIVWLSLIHSIAIYPVDSINQPSNNRDQNFIPK